MCLFHRPKRAPLLCLHRITGPGSPTRHARGLATPQLAPQSNSKKKKNWPLSRQIRWPPRTRRRGGHLTPSDRLGAVRRAAEVRSQAPPGGVTWHDPRVPEAAQRRTHRADAAEERRPRPRRLSPAPRASGSSRKPWLSPILYLLYIWFRRRARATSEHLGHP